MKMFANVTAFLVTMAVPCVRKYFCSLNWNEYVLSLAKAWGGGGRGGGHLCNNSRMLCILCLCPQLVVYLCISS